MDSPPDHQGSYSDSHPAPAVEANKSTFAPAPGTVPVVAEQKRNPSPRVRTNVTSRVVEDFPDAVDLKGIEAREMSRFIAGGIDAALFNDTFLPGKDDAPPSSNGLPKLADQFRKPKGSGRKESSMYPPFVSLPHILFILTPRLLTHILL